MLPVHPPQPDSGADVRDRGDARGDLQRIAAGALAGDDVDGRPVAQRPRAPQQQGDDDAAAQPRAGPHDRRPGPRPHVDVGRRQRERGGDQQADGDRHREPGQRLMGQDVLRPGRVQRHEPADGEEGQRQEEDAGVTAHPGRLARDHREAGRGEAHQQEEDEVQRRARPLHGRVVGSEEEHQAGDRQAEPDDHGHAAEADPRHRPPDAEGVRRPDSSCSGESAARCTGAVCSGAREGRQGLSEGPAAAQPPSRASCSALSRSPAAAAESSIDAGREAPGMGTTTSACARCHASVTR